MVTAVAIVCVRDEAVHIRRCLSDLIRDGIDVLLIDNESNDDTVALAREFLGRGLLAIVSLPWLGAFSLDQQLSFKAELIEQVHHDWVLHVDADESLSPPTRGQTLVEGLGEVDAWGFNCVNFHEFVFVPPTQHCAATESYRSSMLTYYFHQAPSQPHMRAWRRSARLSNIEGAGHVLTGQGIRIWPQAYILRHYVMLDRSHGLQKYQERRYAQNEIDRGWHNDRIIINEKNLIVKNHPALRTLAFASSRAFQTDYPVETHFWQW